LLLETAAEKESSIQQMKQSVSRLSQETARLSEEVVSRKAVVEEAA
jgi:hypothetical protein